MILITNNITMILLLFISIVSICSFYFLAKLTKKDSGAKNLDSIYGKIKEDIKFSIAPKFVELSVDVNDLVDLAVEVWRMEQRIIKSAANLPENQLKGLENSVQKLKRYLEKYDIEVVDYKNTKYNDGLNLDVLSVEKDSAISESMVKETIEPTVICKGQVVRKAKIILLSNN